MSAIDSKPVLWEDLQVPSSENNLLDSVAGDLKRKSIAIRKVSSQNQILSYVEDSSTHLLSSKSTVRKTWRKSLKNKIQPEFNNIPKEQLHDYLANALFNAGYNLRGMQFEDLLQIDITDEYQKCLHIVSTYTTMNYFGKSSPASDGPQKILNFINQIIPLSSKDKEKSVHFSKKIEPPPFVLTLKIIEARDLVALDANGLSDPFCKVWLKSVKQDIKMTSIKKATLNPEWKETFHFNLKNVKKDVICIHIWDDDPVGLMANLREARHIRSFRGCLNFCRDCSEDTCSWGRETVDDFIGKTYIEVSDVYSEGVDEWLSLKDEYGQHHQGELHVAIKFEVQRPKETLDALKRHFLLVKLCLGHGMKLNEVNDMCITTWEHILNSSAQTLLFQHSVQGNIYVFEDFVCKFVNVVQLAKQHISFDFQFLHTILAETQESIISSTDYTIDSPLDGIYRQAVESLDSICLQILSNLHSFDLTESDIKRIQFEFVLRCVSLCQDTIGKTSDLFSTLKSEADSWSATKAEELNCMSSGKMAETLLDFLNFFIKYQSAADKVFRSVFTKKTYTLITYASFDTILTEPIKVNVLKIAEESLNSKNGGKVDKKEAALKVCISLKSTINYISETANVPCSQLQLGKFLDWFGTETIKDWFKWKEEVVTVKIELIINGDDLQSKLTMCGNRYELHSDSVINAADLIQKELFRLWKLVYSEHHPEFNNLFAWALHNCCMKYAEFLLGLIPIRKLDETFKTGGKRNICAIANNLWSLALFSSELTSYACIELNDENLPQTKHGLQIMCKILCRDIGIRVSPDVAHKIQQVVQSESRREQEKNIREYSRFMTKLVKVDGNHDMSFEIRLLFISEIWNHVIKTTIGYKNSHQVTDENYDSCVNRCRRCLGRSANVFEGLLNVLKETEKFCYLDSDGKLKQIMWNDEYNLLKSDLEQMSRRDQR